MALNVNVTASVKFMTNIFLHFCLLFLGKTRQKYINVLVSLIQAKLQIKSNLIYVFIHEITFSF